MIFLGKLFLAIIFFEIMDHWQTRNPQPEWMYWPMIIVTLAIIVVAWRAWPPRNLRSGKT